MTDREMLELAAKAAGHEVARSRLTDPLHRDMLIRHDSRNPGQDFSAWNPLADDGDALRLAVKLRIDLLMDGPGVQSPTVEAIGNTGAEVQPFAIEALDTTDPFAATRRAITRAAAEIARQMP